MAVSLQTTVEVVQVLDTAYLAGSGIEELRGQRLRQRVIAFLLIAAHQVVAVLLDHAVKLGYLVGGVLQVGIHRDDHVTLCFGEATVESRALSIVAAELDAFHLWMLLVQLLDDRPGAVGGAVADEDDLISELMLIHYTGYPAI